MKILNLALAFIVGVLVACGGNSTASSGGGNTSELQLIGHAGKKAVVTDAITPNAVTSACPDLGVITPLQPTVAGDVVYHTCAGAYYETNMDTGTIPEPPVLFFVSTDCSGTPLATVGSDGGETMVGLYYRSGYVFAGPDGMAWQTAPNQVAVSETASSEETRAGCSSANLTGSFFYAATQADGTLGPTSANVGADQTLTAP